ncbi:hypothetical protein BME96_16080 [Virgibacillus halodenitrificans]|uniref:Glycosyltransferase 2-like domain-containing protein n=1 Tax=Virgibacillus halodenitrificans TaxID=1482 RepID=A0AAC9NMF0_VIRHA|nr:glycosyltransferase [Virgibacillus halodenitrificans]APC49616.1 hypothetical protein BME96_16080 [Virgibacillus halodenitrificans]
MGSPKVSIIIPIYNSEEFLDKCIKSVINQTYSNLEIILVNDGSTDKSLEICRKFKKIDSRIILIDKENGGVSTARNTGLDIATGDYIGFVDSDDFISNKMYQKMIESMIQNNSDVVECGYFTCDSKYKNIKIHELRDSIIDGEYQCSYMYLSKTNTTNYNVNKLYKKSLFDHLRYPGYKFSEDYWVNTKIFFKCQRKVTLKECFYYYVMNDQSAVRKDFEYNKRIDTIKAAQDLYEFHYHRYPDLCPFIALYICGYVLTFYFNLNMNTTNNKIYKQELREIFKKYFPEIKNEALGQIKFKGLYIYMLAFKFNPKFYLILKNIYRKLSLSL